MIRIRQPFFSITTAIVFSLLGLLHAIDAVNGTTLVIGGAELAPGAEWALTGILFLMAYFAIVHMKD